MDVRFDHIVVAVSNLAGAVHNVKQHWGFEARGGGRHDGAGTQNAIVPLGHSYLELVTVIDETEARGHGFGLLVLEALEQGRALGGWAVAVTESPSVEGQRLTRNGVDVMLFGLDEAKSEPGRPFFLYRAPGQGTPGALEAGEPHWHASTLRVGGAALPIGLETAPRGDTRVELVEGTPRGTIHELELTRQDGLHLLLNEECLRTL